MSPTLFAHSCQDGASRLTWQAWAGATTVLSVTNAESPSTFRSCRLEGGQTIVNDGPPGPLAGSHMIGGRQSVRVVEAAGHDVQAVRIAGNAGKWAAIRNDGRSFELPRLRNGMRPANRT